MDNELLDRCIKSLERDKQRLLLILKYEKLIFDSVGIGSPHIQEWKEALKALKDCEVDNG